MQGQAELKVRYFLKSALELASRTRSACPSCGCRQSALVKRKYLVTSLRRCSACRVLFRVPTTSEEENEKFYQRSYQQGFTTEMPRPDELRQLKRTMFRNTEKGYGDYLGVLDAIGMKPGIRLLDYGSSWGYGSWQIQHAGYSVQSYEISRPRCEYAKKNLGVDATWDIEAVVGPFDVFFSAHVLEHVPSVGNIIDFSRDVLKPGGWFVAFTPNGSDAYRKVESWNWQRSWGMVHPNLLDNEFYRYVFRNLSHLILSTPYDHDAIEEWARNADRGINQKTLSLTGSELLCVAKMPSS